MVRVVRMMLRGVRAARRSGVVGRLFSASTRRHSGWRWKGRAFSRLRFRRVRARRRSVLLLLLRWRLLLRGRSTFSRMIESTMVNGGCQMRVVRRGGEFQGSAPRHFLFVVSSLGRPEGHE